jgi:two-component system, NtrC family, response regulator GlrR
VHRDPAELLTEELAPRLGTYELQRFRVVVVAGPDVHQERASDKSELSIGTSEGNSLVLTDSAVSRHHCTITVTERGFLLRDLDSTNGTFLAGFRVEAAYLEPGATIVAGVTTLRFEPLDERLEEPLSPQIRFGGVLGKSVSMRRIFGLLHKISPTEATVLLEGETGTGKGLVARTIHQQSGRASGPFVVIDCGSIPPTLIESELFGYVKGAFTGATTDRAGAFETAKGGTIFLDEIGELPLELQPKLLRALEERVIKRVGSQQPIELDVRVVAATNRDLRQAVNRGSFRSDLFYRLDIMRLRIPSLRERREDIRMLVTQFFHELSGDSSQGPPRALVETLERHDWPGNVRELRSAVERAVITGDPALWAGLMDSAPVTPPAGTNPYDFDPVLSFRDAKALATTSWERWFITELMAKNENNLSKAARAAKMDRSHLRQLVKRYLKED